VALCSALRSWLRWPPQERSGSNCATVWGC